MRIDPTAHKVWAAGSGTKELMSVLEALFDRDSDTGVTIPLRIGRRALRLKRAQTGDFLLLWHNPFERLSDRATAAPIPDPGAPIHAVLEVNGYKQLAELHNELRRLLSHQYDEQSFKRRAHREYNMRVALPAGWALCISVRGRRIELIVFPPSCASQGWRPSRYMSERERYEANIADEMEFACPGSVLSAEPEGEEAATAAGSACAVG